MSRKAKGQPSGEAESPPCPRAIAGVAGSTPLPEVRLPDRWRTAVTCPLLALVVWVVFGQTLQHEFLNCDDDVYVTDNPHVWAGWTWNGVSWAFKNLQAGFWHPLTWLSLMTDAQFHELQAGGFHLTNVMLHLANTLMLFLLLRQLTSAHWPSAFVAALFAVHPLHVESVAWIAERKGLLSTLFLLLSLWAYGRYARKSESRVQNSGLRNKSPDFFLHSPFYWLALLFFALGLMSKTMVVTLPAVMLLLDYWPLQRVPGAGCRVSGAASRSTNLPPRSSWLTLLSEKIPFFALALAAGWLTLHAEKGIGALSHGVGNPLVHRIANAALSSAWYLWRTIWPADLAVFYPYTGSFPVGWVVGSGLLLVGISAAALWLGRRYPYLAVGWFWYVITLSPVSGVIQIGVHARADRYTYVPLIGIFLVAGWGAAELCRSGRYRRAFLGAAAVASLAALLVAARAQAAHWRDSVSLWTRALTCAPEHFLSLNNLGNALAEKGRSDEAVPYYERALKLNPTSALARVNLGNKLAAEGKLDEAISHFEQALQIDPGLANAHYNLGLAFAVQRKWDEAVACYERALVFKPDYIEVRVNLGNALGAQGKLDEAVAQYQRVLALKPGFAEVRYNLGNTLSRLGKMSEAAEQYGRAIQLKSDYLEAHNNLGIALAKQGKLDEALQHFQQAVNLATMQGKPDLAEDIRRRMDAYRGDLPQPKAQ